MNPQQSLITSGPGCIKKAYVNESATEFLTSGPGFTKMTYVNESATEFYTRQGSNPGFLERGSICIKVWGVALLILSHFFLNIP